MIKTGGVVSVETLLPPPPLHFRTQCIVLNTYVARMLQVLTDVYEFISLQKQ